MKKFLLAVALLGGVFAANAQEEVSYAPKAGTFSTEVQFNPFSGKNVFENGGVFSGAYFLTDKFAVTLDFGLSGTNTKDVSYDSNDKEAGYVKEYEGKFTLGLGAKYYFYNYKRLNLYCGAKVSYIHNFAGHKDCTDIDADNYTWNNVGTGNGFSIYATTGLNFNLYKGLYVGAELQAGFEDTVYTGATYKTKYNGKVDENKVKAGGHSFDGGFHVTPLFILGWSF